MNPYLILGAAKAARIVYFEVYGNMMKAVKKKIFCCQDG